MRGKVVDAKGSLRRGSWHEGSELRRNRCEQIVSPLVRGARYSRSLDQWLAALMCATSSTLVGCAEKEEVMKTHGLLGLALLVMSAVLLAFDIPISYARPVPRAAAACFFVGTCSTLGGVTTCTCSGTLDATAEALNVVESESGEETLHCSGDLNGNAPDQTTTCEGASLGTSCTLDPATAIGAISGKKLVTTVQWQEVITRSGEVTLDCHFRP